MNDSVLFSSKSIDWSTPQELFDALDKRFQFTLDVCASDKNAKVKRYLTRELDGLGQSWGGERCWMNPPYGREIGPWVKKAHREAEHGALVVGLLPARPETRWWQEHVNGKADLRFIAGRLRFGEARNCAPFASVIAVWWGWGVLDGWFPDRRRKDLRIM